MSQMSAFISEVRQRERDRETHGSWRAGTFQITLTVMLIGDDQCNSAVITSAKQVIYSPVFACYPSGQLKK